MRAPYLHTWGLAWLFPTRGFRSGRRRWGSCSCWSWSDVACRFWNAPSGTAWTNMAHRHRGSPGGGRPGTPAGDAEQACALASSPFLSCFLSLPCSFRPQLTLMVSSPGWLCCNWKPFLCYHGPVIYLMGEGGGEVWILDHLPKDIISLTWSLIIFAHL